MRFKKLLVAMCTAALVLGTVASASAATFSDVGGTKYADASARLAALNILAGFPDGTFRPQESVTRAQMAAIIVRALGLDSAAQYVKVDTKFSDVAGNHWASGYINVAVDQGIINGYPDGTFKPEAQVTYAEALAMILRALGYEPTLKGAWPTKYLVKAAELGITKNVTFSANAAAGRGDVAVLVDQSLTVPKVVQIGFGDTAKYVVSGTEGTDKRTLLTSLQATAVEGVLLDSPELFGVVPDMIKVWADANSNGTVDSGETSDLKLGSSAAYKGLLGHKVKAWKGADGSVFFIEDLTPADKVKTATYDGSTLKIGTTVLTFASGAYKVVNFQRGSLSAATDLGSTVDNDEVTVILNDEGQVTWATATNLTTKVVDSVSTGFQSIAFSGGGSLSVKDKTVTYVGAASKLDEIQKDDVVEYTEASVGGKTYVYIVVTRNPKSGEFSRLVDGTPDKVTVGGTEYSGISTFNADSSLLGKDVTVLLNKHGKVVSMKSATVDTKLLAAMKGDAYSVNTAQGPQWYLRLVKTDGSEVRLQVAKGAFSGFDPDTANSTTFSTANLVDKSIVEYSLNADGAISSVAAVIPGTVPGSTLNTYKDYNQIDAGDGGRALVVADTAIFNITGSVAGRPLAVSLSQLMGDASLTAKVELKPGTRVAKAIAITGGFDAPAPTTYGLVMAKYQTSGPKYYLSINSNGSTADYEVDVTRFVYGTDAVVRFNPADVKNTVTGADELSVSSSVYTWKVQEIDSANKLVYIDEYDTTTGLENPTERRTAILILGNTQVFNLNGDQPATLARFEDIAVGQEVRVYYDPAAPGVAKVFVIK